MLSRAGRRRGSNSAKRENSDRWLLTYADLITLLLAFFVIMYGMSSADARKFSRLAESMRKAFNVDVLQGMPGESILEQSVPMSAVNAGSEDLTSSEVAGLDLLYGELSGFFEQEGFADKVEIGIRPEGVAISISGNMLFASGRAELRPDSIELLHALGRGLSQIPNHLRVEGHTDDVPPLGTEFPTNWELSGARSVAVVRHLVEAEGIAPRRVSAVAYSQYQPAAPNDTARSRAKNRRTEVLVIYPAPSTGVDLPAREGTNGGTTPDREMNSVSATR